MQAYEHIMATMLKLAKTTVRSQGLNLQEHMSENAWMEFIIGDELKNSNNGYPSDKIYIPEGMESKAAVGPTDLQLAIEHNQKLLKTREVQAIFEHLKQDIATDFLFQKYIATCYIDDDDAKLETEKDYSLYGGNTKPGLARLNQTGKIVPISEFREIVSMTQKLTTLELYRALKKVYPEITFEKIKKAVCESYEKKYPEVMMNAKKYVVHTQDEQTRSIVTFFSV